MIDIKAKLLAACNGHPAAEIPWPHRLLHDAVEHIDSQQARIEELEAAAQKRVDCGHDDECGGKQRDRCGCGHTDLENALEGGE